MNRKWYQNLWHVIVYGLSITLVIYPDRLPFVHLSWLNEHMMKGHYEWKNRRAYPGKAHGWRTWGLIDPVRKVKAYIHRNDPPDPTFDF